MVAAPGLHAHRAFTFQIKPRGTSVVCRPSLTRPLLTTLWPRLLLLLLVIPIVELALLIWLGGQIGVWPTIALIALTAVLGSWLAQREGLAVWRRFTSGLAAGQLPGKELTDGLIILVSGALLLAPGVLTDLAGFLGLLPPTRAMIRGFLYRRLQRGVATGSVRVYGSSKRWGQPPSAPAPPEDEDILDVPFQEFERGRQGPPADPRRELPGRGG